MPWWPKDFDYGYFQAAPFDQQIPYPRGGEEVALAHLTPEGITRFTLPTIEMPVLFIPFRGDDRELKAQIDTVLIEPEDRRIMLTWRATLPLVRNCFELKRVIVGKMPRTWHRLRRLGRKPYYKGLAALIRAKKDR